MDFELFSKEEEQENHRRLGELMYLVFYLVHDYLNCSGTGEELVHQQALLLVKLLQSQSEGSSLLEVH